MIQTEVLGQHPHDELAAAPHAKLAVQTLEVGVHGVLRDVEIVGDRELFQVIEDAPNDLELTMGQPQRTGHALPIGLREDFPAGAA